MSLICNCWCSSLDDRWSWPLLGGRGVASFSLVVGFTFAIGGTESCRIESVSVLHNPIHRLYHSFANTKWRSGICRYRRRKKSFLDSSFVRWRINSTSSQQLFWRNSWSAACWMMSRKTHPRLFLVVLATSTGAEDSNRWTKRTKYQNNHYSRENRGFRISLSRKNEKRGRLVHRNITCHGNVLIRLSFCSVVVFACGTNQSFFPMRQSSVPLYKSVVRQNATAICLFFITITMAIDERQIMRVIGHSRFLRWTFRIRLTGYFRPKRYGLCIHPTSFHEIGSYHYGTRKGFP